MAGTKGGFPERFVGRNEELGILEQVVGEGPAGALSVVIRGEAGIGKTRLLSESTLRAQQRGIRVAHGSCYPVAEAGPYAPLLQIAGQLVSRGREPALDRLLRRVAGSRRRLAHGSAQEGRARRARLLRDAAATLIQATTGDLTLLCLEDLQWADIGSLLLVNYILDARSTNVRFIGTFRTGEPTADVGKLLSRIEQRSYLIELKGLREEELRLLARQLVGSGKIGDREVQTLQSFTRGNPLFLRELLLHLRDRGLLERHDVLEAILLTRIPDQLNGIIQARFASFPRSARRVLAAAATFGSEFDGATLAMMLNEEERIIESELDRGFAAGVLWRTNAGPSSGYEFAHPLLAKSLYDSLSLAQRRDLHRSIADSGHSGRITMSVSELARHHAIAFASGGHGRAVSYCRAAAQEAEQLLAFETAAHFWELALACGPRSPRLRAELLRRLGQNLASAGRWDHAIHRWRDAVDEYGAFGDMARVAKMSLAIGELHLWRQELDQAAHWLSRGLQHLSKSSAARTKGLALLASVRCVQGEEQGPRLLDEAFESTRNRALDPSIAFWLSHGLSAIGEFDRFRDISTQGLTSARRVGATQSAALLAGNLVLSELSLARSNHLDEYLALVEEAATDSADMTALIRLLLCKTLISGYRGDWLSVSDLCEGWMRELRLASKYQLATAQVIWGEAQSMLNQSTSAVEAVTQALPDLRQMHPLAAVHLARIFLRAGAHASAAELAHRHHEEVINTPRLAGARLILGDVAASLEEPLLWEECYAALQAERRPMVVGYCATSVQRVVGRLAGRLRRWDEAVEHFESAVEQLSRGSAFSELATTFGDYAAVRSSRGRRGDDRKAAALERQASSLFERLGPQFAQPVPPSAVRSQNGAAFDLTGREHEVLLLAAEGRRNREIAEALTLSERTVERHMENIFAKLAVETRTEAVVKAVEAGLIGPLEARRVTPR